MATQNAGHLTQNSLYRPKYSSDPIIASILNLVGFEKKHISAHNNRANSNTQTCMVMRISLKSLVRNGAALYTQSMRKV